MLWDNGIRSILEALGHRFDPWQAQWVKDPALLRLRSPLQLGSDPWSGNSLCHRAAKKKKKIIYITLCILYIFYYQYYI